MSRNVDIVRASYDAYEAEDFEALFALADPEVEIHEWPEGPDPRVYRGHEGIIEAREVWAQAWEYITAQPLDFVEAGDRVLVFLRSMGKGRGSSIEVELETFAVHTMRGSKVAKVEYFVDRDAAMRAAGLTDDQMRQQNRLESRLENRLENRLEAGQ